MENNKLSYVKSDTLKLQKWIVKNKINHKNSNELLKIMKVNMLPSLPKSTLTLLNSNMKFNIREMQTSDGSNGQFHYFGMKRKLEEIVKIELHDSNIIELIINSDGISSFKSSSVSIWPTLCKVYIKGDRYYEPFTVSVYAGNGKP